MPSDPNIGFLNGKERKEWVNFLKFGSLGMTIGRLVDWNFGRTTDQL
jgi:hypothetical protein